MSMIGRTIDQYRILSKLGQGGMGEVYLAEDTTLGRRVALKILPESFAGSREALERFQREARAAAALEHPGIVAIHEVGSVDGRPYIVMAHVDGQPLNEIIAAGRLPLEQVRHIVRDVAEALAAAHRAGVIHRDVKPSNIVVDSSGRARLLDFGLAKLDDTTALTEANVIMGTAQYMSPEQLRGGEVDTRTDVFSLGAVLYELLTGRTPFGGENREATFYSILNHDPRPPRRPGEPDSEPLSDIALRALCKDREGRYASMDDMAGALRGMEPSRPPAHNSRWVWPGILLGVLAAIFLMWRGGNRSGGDRAAEAPQRLIGSLVTTQMTFDAGIEGWPAWSPDGTRLLYVSETEGHRHLSIRTLSGGSERRITRGDRDDIQPAWSADGKTVWFARANLASGYLAPGDVLGFYYEGGDVWSLDVSNAVEGPFENEPVKVIDDAFNPAPSPDGVQIAFDADRSAARRIWITDARGRNPIQLTTDESEAVVHVTPRWSPDGKRIAYRRVEKTRADIEVIDVASRIVQRVTSDAFNDLDPAWSPDGRHLYFSSYRGGGLNIWRVDVARADVTAPEQITTGAGDDMQPSLSPDGRRLAFAVQSLNSDLWTIPLDPASGRIAGEPRAMVATTREDSRGAWSPDGRTIAFNSDRLGDMNIWLHSLEDGTDRQLTRGPGGDYQADWSPDGRLVTFFSSRAGNADIWVVDAVAGAMRQLTQDPGLDINPFYSPTGTYIAFQSDRGGRFELWVMMADGSNPRRVARAEASGHFMRWFRDGKHILFASGDGADRKIYRVDVTSGELETMPKISSGAHLSLSPDQTRVLEVQGHRSLWIYPLDGALAAEIFMFDDPDIRIDYPVWSPDGREAVFDRGVTSGGDIWMIDGLR
jgi:Tol biopolymer transport system component